METRTITFNEGITEKAVDTIMDNLSHTGTVQAVKNNAHIGWSNYATWRINLERISTRDAKDFRTGHKNVYALADHIKEMVEQDLTLDSEDTETPSYVYDYAQAFLNDVDWVQIAKGMIERNPGLL